MNVALLVSLPLAVLFAPQIAEGASTRMWDGTWAGVLNNKEPVSVTINEGKVIAYTIRGGEPYPIEYNNVTTTTVSFGDHANYAVNIRRTGGRSAIGTAHGPMGDGSASLQKQ
jgi:hypothetical protein